MAISGTTKLSSHQTQSSVHHVAAVVTRPLALGLHEAHAAHEFADRVFAKLANSTHDPKTAQENAEAIKRPFDYVAKPKEVFETIITADRTLRDINRSGEAARVHVKMIGQMAYDVQRVKRQALLLRYWEQTFDSKFARDLLLKTEPGRKALESTYLTERAYVRDYAAIMKETVSRGLHLEAASAATAKAMLAVERRLQQSPFGKHILQTGRVLTNINVMRALDTFGAAADAFDAYEHSKNQSAPGKQINAQLGGYLSLGAARSGLTAADPVLGKVFGKANTVGSFYRGVADTISAYVDVAFKHDSDALNAVHKANMSGKYGSVLQGYAMIGDVISKSGWIDNKISYAADRMSGVPKDFRTSLVWWGSH